MVACLRARKLAVSTRPGTAEIRMLLAVVLEMGLEDLERLVDQWWVSAEELGSGLVWQREGKGGQHEY